MTYYPSMTKFPPEWNIKRDTLNDPSKYPKYTYGKTFEESYDYDTLFADVFRNENQMVFVSPPFLNFRNILQSMKLIDGKSNTYDLNFGSFDRCEVVVSNIPDTVSKIFLQREDGEKFEINYRDRYSKFDDKRVLCTMVKNEPISKILNWVEYHIVNYNVEGFLIFNNQSTIYSSEELYVDLIKNQPNGIIEVVDWDMPFGMIGPPWDSDWSQYILLNLCKYNFCLRSCLILNHDIDEYFVSKYSLEEILGSMIDQNLGAIVYESKNISCYTGGNTSILNTRYYYHPDDVNEVKMTKWMAIPSKTMQSIYTLHNVYGTNTESTNDFYYAHMWALSSHNHDQENHSSPKKYRKNIKESGYKIDFQLKYNFENCSNLIL
jgi:hypothetical protein